ncbi:pyrroline-5-carboxylate reductase [Thiorhodovibrio frisius]|uniref:Pyrroline-5-carboxylate reductase n=1 Tax=Thiorhodovibrio frisius TaxID=631362 RepID=H8Z7N4_9GAMM|nr:pyrroline-5-carboxylate reductase [Thiorhodovibrio frisius]EIC19887.1 pyrroline-5-carboxylate reductase [Thiorhodovibrio frisius]WPL20615.1 Pyrroline-5-carboxylate reductase [Thiorhodovibrio frisius]
MSNTSLTFIGGGNMARSLIAGLIADDHEPAAIRVVEPDAAKCEQLRRHFGVTASADTQAMLQGARVVVLSVKPQVAAGVCRALAPLLPASAPLVISVMAGVTNVSIQHWLGRSVPLVRAMPNTPALVQSGAIGLYANAQASEEERNLAEEILRAAGLTQWVESEADIDAVTALSGSGPAYFLLLMEAMEQAGIRQGLDAETARLLTIQTALGSARLAMESDESPAELRARVTSPGGTTERAIACFDEGGFSGLVDQAIAAARARAAELSAELS